MYRLGSATGADRPELYLDFDLGTPYAQRDTILSISTAIIQSIIKKIFILEFILLPHQEHIEFLWRIPTEMLEFLIYGLVGIVMILFCS